MFKHHCTTTKQPAVPAPIHSLQTEAAQMKATHSASLRGTELPAMWSQGGVSLFPCQCTLSTVRACKVMLSSKATQRNPDAPLPWRGLAPRWVLIGQMGLLVINKLAILNDNLKSFISRMFMCTLCTWTGISYKLLGCDTPPENRNLAFRAYR